MKQEVVIPSPISELRIGFSFQNDLLVTVDFLPPTAILCGPSSELDEGVIEQVQRYFSGSLSSFDIPLFEQGTSFQQRVWSALQLIPYGEVVTYGALAERLNTSARAVGNACRTNPIPLIVPCHRVVSANSIGGFMGRRNGDELNIKRWLLAHEGVRGYE